MDTQKDGLRQLSALAELQHEAEIEVERLTMELESAQRAVRSFSTKQIPDLMEDLDMASYTTTSGMEIKIKETIRANLPKGRLDAGLEWLRDNGHGGVIKSSVVVPFATGDDDAAMHLVDRLEGESIACTFEEKVNPQTLSAMVRALLADGEVVDFELLGVFTQRVAKLKMKK